MTKPFDAALNAMIADHLADWARFLADRIGIPPGARRRTGHRLVEHTSCWRDCGIRTSESRRSMRP